MAETPYLYDIGLDFPDQKVSSDRLDREIRQSPDITVALERIETDVAVGDCTIIFKDALGAAEKTALDAIVAAHSGEPILDPLAQKKDIQGNLLVAQVVAVGGGFRKVTHNFCDSCTWWQESVEVVDGPTTSGGSETVYTLDSGDTMIDVRHGRLPFEDEVTVDTVAPNGNTMTNVVPVVKVNDVALDETNEDATSGDDRYTIDYESGAVTFGVARQQGDTVTVSYRKPGSSLYTFKPPAGKQWSFEDAEIDASEDVDMTAPFRTAIHGSHTTITGGSVVEVGSRTYKSFHDFQAAARRFWGPLPSGFGGAGGISSPKWTFEWQYARSDLFYATANYVDKHIDSQKVTFNRAEGRIVGDVPYGGHFLTLTYYGQETDEGTGS